MTRIGAWCGLAALLLCLTGCESGAPSTPPGPSEPTKDGRPAGFEDMMKGMGDQMKSSAAGAKNAPTPAPAGAAPAGDAEKK